MFKRIADLVRGRHFWRRASFSEISALYIAKILRWLALNLASTFILVMMYQKGYSLLYIIIYSAFYAFLCFLATPLAAILTAKFGAKMVLLISNILFVPTMLLFSQIDNLGEIVITIGGAIQAFANVFYQVAHDVIFSEVKSTDNAGQEIGYMAVFEKITTVVAPFIGGFISSFISPQVTMGLASILFVISTMPLFQAQGVAKKSHFFDLRDFPFGAYWREFVFQISLGFTWLSTRIWPLFLIIAVFTTDDPFVVVGIFTSISALASVIAAFLFGKLIDKSSQSGRKVFLISSLANALSVLWRSVIKTPFSVAMNLIYNESAVVVQNMAALRAQFDSADRSGSRVTYIMMRHLFWNFFSFLACLVLIFLLIQPSGQTFAMRLYFGITSVFAATYFLSNYRLYRKK